MNKESIKIMNAAKNSLKQLKEAGAKNVRIIIGGWEDDQVEKVANQHEVTFMKPDEGIPFHYCMIPVNDSHIGIEGKEINGSKQKNI